MTVLPAGAAFLLGVSVMSRPTADERAASRETQRLEIEARQSVCQSLNTEPLKSDPRVKGLVDSLRTLVCR